MDILIIEDIRFSSLLVENQLRQFGHHAFSVTSGYEALDLLEDGGKKVDLVICDLHLPDMNGFRIFEECQKIKHLSANPPPFILLTSSKDPRDLEAAENMGFLAALTKPVNVETLQEILTTIDAGHLVTRSNQGKSKILIVDPDGKNAEVVQDIFTGSGYTLICATSGSECLDYMFQSKNICMVICDLQLGNTNAMGLLKDIRNAQDQFPGGQLPSFVLMTESKDIDMLQIAQLSGFADIINMPADKYQVKQKLSKILVMDPGNQHARKSILIIDDIGFHCALTKTILSQLPYIREERFNLITAENVGEALDHLKTDRTIQLVVSDLYLPDGTGIELLREFKSLTEGNLHLFGNDYKPPPFILVTIASDSTTLDSASKAGFQQVFRKPMDPKTFLPAVMELLCPVQPLGATPQAAEQFLSGSSS